MVIGITGSIGTGKSAFSQMIIDKGYLLLDADKLSHEALNKGTSSYNQIITLFNCINDEGEIDRKKLGSIIFNDPIKRKQLEDIIHPYVYNTMLQATQENEIVFLDVPLMYESHFDELCDTIVVITCDESIQIERIINRDHCTKEEALKRIKAQMSQEEKIKRADFVINNNDDLASLKKEVGRFLSNEIVHI